MNSKDETMAEEEGKEEGGELEGRTEDDFFASVSESAAKLLLHLAWLTETGVQLGDVERLVAVAGGLALIRNKLWHYNEVILTKEGGRRFGELYQETSHLADAVCDQIGLYHSSTLATVVLQDSQSQDWEDPKAWHEGERLSCSVQLWWFSIQAARHTLFSSLPPTSSSAILLRLLSDSLSLFAHRYSNLSPTAARLAQFRCDLVAILLGTAQLLPSISPSLESLSHPASHAKLPAIHTKAETLMAALVMVTAPVSSIAAELVSNPKPGQLPALRQRAPQRETWASLLCPSLCLGEKQPKTKDEKLHRVSLLVKLVASQAHPAWGLQVQACLSSGALLPTSLLTQMGAFVPPNPAGDTTQATCGLSSCSELCLGPAGPLWPIQVALPIPFFSNFSVLVSGCSWGSPPTCPALLPSWPAQQIFSASSRSSLPTLLGLSSGILALEPPSTCLASSTLSPPGALVGTCSSWVAEGGGGGKDLDPGPPGEGSQTAGDRTR